MFLDIVGYALPKKDAKGQSAVSISNFQGIPCRAFEINHKSKSVLLIDPAATGLAMLDFEQLESFFECKSFSGLLVPKDMSDHQALEYLGRVYSHPQNRKRDMEMIRKLIIVQSLAKGCFTDTLYFHFADEPKN